MISVKKIEHYRQKNFGPWSSDIDDGNNGAFQMPIVVGIGRRVIVNIIVSDGGGWEHVSVSINGVKRCPTWEEMCIIKELLWDDEDIVVQFHPKKSEYVSCHSYTLHLWRPTDKEIPTPPSIMVGPSSHIKR